MNGKRVSFEFNGHRVIQTVSIESAVKMDFKERFRSLETLPQSKLLKAFFTHAEFKGSVQGARPTRAL